MPPPPKRPVRPPGDDTPRILSPRTARELAYDVLASTSLDDLPTRTLEQHLDRLAWKSNERGLAIELVHGVIRRMATLDAVIRPHVLRPWDRVEKGLRTILRLGAYQLLLLDGVPPHAAVHETVSLAARCHQPRWTGFANGVLRSLSQSLTGERLAEPGPDALPCGEFHRQLTAAVFPDPTDSPADYLAAAFSFPKWLIKRWLSHESFEQVCRWCFWFNSPPRVCLRVNRTQGSRDDFLRELAAAGVACRAGHHPLSLWVDEGVHVASLPGFSTGRFVVQDESAIAAGELLPVSPGMRVLDLCAAPGGKTTQLAERVTSTGSVLAVDVSASRLNLVTQTARRLGLRNIETAVMNEAATSLPDSGFDAALVDVPCSNTGVLGKRPEARWRLNSDAFAELADLQSRLLRIAIDAVKPGGHVVYSTCSIEPDENERLVAAVCSDRSDLMVTSEQRHRPGDPGDGAYQALIHKLPERDRGVAAT
jgi:16S rRNA (cytosine967-C5)-methyltransferase